ncbi:DUF2306 domain-containing protein [Terrilactibacillus sp. S3-3]|nr:DUF2306 domain-containing protein [Terrilactibacillus sp. S3-3]
MNGYIYMIGVFVICLTSGYMAPSSTGGRISSIAFDLINLLWPFITLMAFIKIKKGQVERHRRWMIRSYAFCFTNLFIHLLGFLFHSGLGMTFVASYIAAVYGAILLDLLTAELVIHKISMIKETDLSI